MSNTFSTPASTSTIALARIDWNDSVDALLTTFYGPAVPVVSNFTILGDTPAAVSDGTMFRSSSLGTLFIKDDVNHQSNPFYGGNFTRNGIGYIVEENIVALIANIANRERGEVIITPSPNTRVYVKSTTGGSTFVDIGIPPTNSITTTMLTNNSVTSEKVGTDVAVLTQTQIFTGTQTIVRDDQISLATGSLLAVAETGNVIIGLSANGNSSAGISHSRDDDGVKIVASDGISLAPLDASDLLINGASVGSGIGGLSSIQVFTSNGTWTRPGGITKIVVYGVAGGGGGAGAIDNDPDVGNGSGGGGAGGYSWRFLDVTSIPSANVVIGSGGSGGVSQGNGSNGGNTSFDSFINCIAGGGGNSSSTRFGGSSGTSSSGDINIPGQAGEAGNEKVGGSGGNSMMGLGGARERQNQDGVNAGLFGAGGGGASGSANSGDGDNGGNGSAGIIVVMEYE